MECTRIPLSISFNNNWKQVNNQNEIPAVVPIQNLFAHKMGEYPPVGNHINANNFELKLGLVQMAEANAFGRRATKDPNKHLTKFVQISNTVKHNGVSDEMIRLRLFPFSLNDAAKDWYDNLEPDSILTWNEMVRLFLEKFFLPSEALKRQAEIIQFMMMNQESVHDAWERYKEILKNCPNHGYSVGHQVCMFYRGAKNEVRGQLNCNAGGSFLDLGVDATMKMLERMASNGEEWTNERNKSYRVASTSDTDHMNAMAKQIDLLTKKVEFMGMGQPGGEFQEGVEDVNYVLELQQLPLQPRRWQLQSVWQQGAPQPLLWKSQQCSSTATGILSFKWDG